MAARTTFSLQRGGGVPLLAALLFGASLAAPVSAAPNPVAQRTSVAQSFLKALQHHSSTVRYLTANATLRVECKQIRGARAIDAWWKMQFRAGLKVQVMSKVVVRNAVGQAILRRSTRTGACARGCTEGVSWHFIGTRVQSMTLTMLPTPGVPKPPAHVPSPPSSRPKTTPTIPS